MFLAECVLVYITGVGRVYMVKHCKVAIQSQIDVDIVRDGGMDTGVELVCETI
jgi:hypothetical protein